MGKTEGESGTVEVAGAISVARVDVVVVVVVVGGMVFRFRLAYVKRGSKVQSSAVHGHADRGDTSVTDR